MRQYNIFTSSFFVGTTTRFAIVGRDWEGDHQLTRTDQVTTHTRLLEIFSSCLIGFAGSRRRCQHEYLYRYKYIERCLHFLGQTRNGSLMTTTLSDTKLYITFSRLQDVEEKHEAMQNFLQAEDDEASSPTARRLRRLPPVHLDLNDWKVEHLPHLKMLIETLQASSLRHLEIVHDKVDPAANEKAILLSMLAKLVAR